MGQNNHIPDKIKIRGARVHNAIFKIERPAEMNDYGWDGYVFWIFN
ncbi:MAG: hypothetical protein HFE76_10325 [Firmicutes bacterium]|nr:hypothetical protein [Bacillota bacterium]